VQAYWDGEGLAATQSKPQLQERTIKLNKLRALVPVTEEILEDASAMDSYLRRKRPRRKSPSRSTPP
jgi:Phage capsid family.